jgi:hypothetical protein
MRDLYQEIKEFYLLSEGLSKEPSSPISRNPDEQTQHRKKVSTNLTDYYGDITTKDTGSEHKLKSSPEHDSNHTTHEVSWGGKQKQENMNMRDRIRTLHDALHLHNDYIENNTEVGHLVKNTPIPNDQTQGVKKDNNKRENLYRIYGGFGNPDMRGTQYGIVKKHPEDHPEEHMRGKKYLHPIDGDDIHTHRKKEYERSKQEEREEDKRNAVLIKATAPFEQAARQKYDNSSDAKRLFTRKGYLAHKNDSSSTIMARVQDIRNKEKNKHGFDVELRNPR